MAVNQQASAPSFLREDILPALRQNLKIKSTGAIREKRAELMRQSGGIYTEGSGLDKRGVYLTAFYLLSSGNAIIDTNDGHQVSIFQGIGINKAIKVIVRSWRYLETFPTNQDVKNACLKAAQDLIDSNIVPSTTIASAESAWASVGVFNELRIRYSVNTLLQVGRSGNLKLTSGWGKSGIMPDSCMKIQHVRTGKGVSLNESELVSGDSVITVKDTIMGNQSVFLNNSNNFVGGLVIKSPDNSAQVFIDSLGKVKTRILPRNNVY